MRFKKYTRAATILDFIAGENGRNVAIETAVSGD